MRQLGGSPFRDSNTFESLDEVEKASLLSELLGMGTSFLRWTGDTLDTFGGGRAIRNLLGGEGINFTEDIRGRDMLADWGLAPKDTYTGFNLNKLINHPDDLAADIAGFGLEVLLDPLTYLTFGTSSVGKLGKVAKGANVAWKLPGVPALSARVPIAEVGRGLGSALRTVPVVGDATLGALDWTGRKWNQTFNKSVRNTIDRPLQEASSEAVDRIGKSTVDFIKSGRQSVRGLNTDVLEAAGSPEELQRLLMTAIEQPPASYQSYLDWGAKNPQAMAKVDEVANWVRSEDAMVRAKRTEVGLPSMKLHDIVDHMFRQSDNVDEVKAAFGMTDEMMATAGKNSASIFHQKKRNPLYKGFLEGTHGINKLSKDAQVKNLNPVDGSRYVMEKYVGTADDLAELDDLTQKFAPGGLYSKEVLDPIRKSQPDLVEAIDEILEIDGMKLKAHQNTLAQATKLHQYVQEGKLSTFGEDVIQTQVEGLIQNERAVAFADAVQKSLASGLNPIQPGAKLFKLGKVLKGAGFDMKNVNGIERTLNYARKNNKVLDNYLVQTETKIKQDLIAQKNAKLAKLKKPRSITPEELAKISSTAHRKSVFKAANDWGVSSSIQKQMVDMLNYDSKIAGGTSEGWQKFLKAAEVVSSTFRGLYTSPWFAFGSRNYQGISWQDWIDGGWKQAGAFKNWNLSHKVLSGEAIDPSAFKGTPWKNRDDLLDDLVARKIIGQDVVDKGVEQLNVLNEFKEYKGVSRYGAGTGLYAASYLDAAKAFGKAVKSGKKEDFAAFSKHLYRNDDTAMVGEVWNRYLEDWGRAASYIRKVKEGMDPVEAALQTKALHVDYSSLSRFEKAYIRPLTLFYTYQSRSIPWHIKNTLRHPGGWETQAERQSKRATEKDQGSFVPERLSGSLPLRSEMRGDFMHILSPDLPFQQIDEFIKLRPTLSSSIQETAKAFASQLNPLIQLPLEGIFGTDLYSGRKLRDLDPRVGRTLGQLATVATNPLESAEAMMFGGSPGYEKNVLTEARPLVNSILLEQLVSNSPLSRASSTLGQLLDTRKTPIERGASLVGGLQVTAFDPVKEQLRAIENNIRLEMEDDPNVRYFSRPYITKERLQELQVFDPNWRPGGQKYKRFQLQKALSNQRN